MVGRGRLVGDVLQEIWEILREITAVQQDTARRMWETDRRMQEDPRLRGGGVWLPVAPRRGLKDGRRRRFRIR